MPLSDGHHGERLPWMMTVAEDHWLPSTVSGFVYLDLKNAIPLIEGFAGLSGTKIPANVSENLRPLRSFLSWSAGSGSSRTFDAFLEIK